MMTLFIVDGRMVGNKPHEATYFLCVYMIPAQTLLAYFSNKKYSLKAKFILTLAEWLGSSLMRQPICIVFVCMIPAQT